jgi:hypothetical protein
MLENFSSYVKCFGTYENDEIEVISDSITSENQMNPKSISPSLVGLGLWRLRTIISPKIASFASHIEGIIRQCCFNDGLNIEPLYEFEYWDTLDPNGEIDVTDPFFGCSGFSYTKNKANKPRLQLENRIYSTRVLRKIHIEMMVRQDGLHALHLMVYPRLEFDLPILRMEVFTKNNEFIQGTIDTSPVRWDTSSPGPYMKSINRLTRNLSISPTLHISEWGQNTYSSLYVSENLSTLAESNTFITYACSLTRFHLEASRLKLPIRMKKETKIKRDSSLLR